MNQKLFFALAVALSGALGAVVDGGYIPTSALGYVVGLTTFVSLLVKNLPAQK